MLDTLYNIADTTYVLMVAITIVTGVIVLSMNALRKK